MSEGFRFVHLFSGQLAIVDEDIFPELNKVRWYAFWNKKTASYYATTQSWRGSERTTVRMHRVVAGAAKGELVDHINHDTLDNRRINLRTCNGGENSMNRIVHGSTCQFKGVTRSSSGKWRARITVKGRTICLGTFATPEEAARSYDEIASVEFGSFALLNFGGAK